jgi:hypothetical protein
MHTRCFSNAPLKICVIRVMFLVQLLHNSYTTLTTFYLRSIIKYLGPTYRKTNLMVDHKKKVVRVVQKWCKNCARIITRFIITMSSRTLSIYMTCQMRLVWY